MENAKSILITGGAGYIGSHIAAVLLKRGHSVVIADNFTSSEPSVVPRIALCGGKTPEVFCCDMKDKASLESLFDKYPDIDCVIHLAGLKSVSESIKYPGLYYENNVQGTINLLSVMEERGVKKLIFSSSATVYSHPDVGALLEKHPLGINEEFPLGTINPYGETKLKIEQILKAAHERAPELKIGILRYFNPVGAHPSGLIGEDVKGVPGNLFPYIMKVARGELCCLSVFGNDYDTSDGTPVRDYIHVMDLAEGHAALLEKLGAFDIYNLGTGRGYTVLEAVGSFEKVTGKHIPCRFSKRREGDMARCWADCTKAREMLGWTAKRSLDDMCRDAWRHAEMSEPVLGDAK